jgi:hypothetical protein
MRLIIGDLSEDSRHKNQKHKMGLVGILVLFGFILPSFYAPVACAGPIYTSDYWEDTFGDMAGIESWDNLGLIAGDISLQGTTIFSDDFTGANGDPPDPAKWDTIDDGYTLEIQNNMLLTASTPDTGSWYTEDVVTKPSFSVAHTLTWRQQHHFVIGTGMYYSFRALNGSDDSGLFGTNQNSADDFLLYNYYGGPDTYIDSDVEGWHDFKVTFNNGYMEFYYDGVNTFQYDYGVASVKYRFGNSQLSEPGSIYTDDVLITSQVTTGNITSTEIILPPEKAWDSVEINKTESSGNYINVTILDGSSFLPIPGYENLSGANIDISGIDEVSYPTIRLLAHFTGDGSNSPVLHDWKVNWRDIKAPTTPTGLTVNNPMTGYSLIISWDANSEPDLEKYVLYFSTDGSTFSWLGNCSSDTVSFIHYGLTIGETYYYKIAAADAVPNQSPNSAVESGIPDIDTDLDGVGNIVDDDDDGDTVVDVDDEFPLSENEWIDTDSDGVGDNADYDDDGDGYDDTIDDFPLNDTEWNDLDSDGIGDNTDDDIDGDGVLNIHDEFPEDPTEWEDTDSDGLGDNKDLDIDGDLVDNPNDVFPYDDSESNDLDGDGIGDNSDPDKDGDGIPNANDAFPDNGLDWKDTDSDGIGDNADDDDDGDDYLDVNDAFPYNSTEWSDIDSDGIGDNADLDIDGDGVGNNADLFPKIGHEWEDYDLDGIGDNSDLDDDNDKHPDTNDDYPYDSSRWQKPNELLFWLYLIIILLIVLIIIGVILMFKSKKEEEKPPQQPFFDMQKPPESQSMPEPPQSLESTESPPPPSQTQDNDIPPPPNE